mmetsp:Transcript_44179/g.140597  ORF Transcript_44179/g.140597 Transcript_44179/m.140597 type:complete len:205 (+) Transcript_44179:202-816(+)
MDMQASDFTVMATGQLESADMPGVDNAYCKYSIVHGEDWRIIEGVEDGITQVTRKSPSNPDSNLVWNFPLDITYKSTNPFGWPQMCLGIYGIDGLGRDVIKGYGCIHLPTAPGSYTLRVRLYRPISSSLLQQWSSWFTGMAAEFTDPKFPARGEGREVTRVTSTGTAFIKVNILTKDMGVFGYSEDGVLASGATDITADGGRAI